ncbi:MAG: ankyrin repeat domain-containing protein [Lachnoclostridium sp.]|jgi:ankyrin repeat protein|nr:ankyrin repeat domain-containing protein [Lachnoclostridium sp.]
MVKNLKKLYNRMEQNEYQELYEKTQNNHSFVFSRDLEGNTLLHYATLEGNFDAVKRLMELGSCATICNEQGYTPLVNAVYCENTALLSYLIENSRVSLLREDEEMLLVHAATAGI